VTIPKYKGKYMKFIIVGVISFTLGITGAGMIALKFFAYGGQSVAAAEIQMSASTLQLLESHQTDMVVNKLCSILPIALKNKAEFDASWFAIEFNYGHTQSDEDIETIAKNMLAKGNICNPITH